MINLEDVTDNVIEDVFNDNADIITANGTDNDCDIKELLEMK
jgi:hypothetical protein